MMRAVPRRIRRLGVLELLNIALLGWVAFVALGASPTPANVVGFGLAAVLLAQGGGYWLLKSAQVTGARRHPRGLPVFRVLRVVNVVVLAAGVAFVGLAAARACGAGTLPGLFFACLAVLEYVNYFHRQLMYGTSADLRWLRRSGRLRRSHLAADLGAPARSRRTRT